MYSELQSVHIFNEQMNDYQFAVHFGVVVLHIWLLTAYLGSSLSINIDNDWVSIQAIQVYFLQHFKPKYSNQSHLVEHQDAICKWGE